MVSEIDDLNIDYEEDGVLVVKQLEKVVLTKGAWATVIFKYKQWERKLEGYGPDRFTIRRYRKRSGEYRQQSKFNISSRDQALKIIAALQTWCDQPEQTEPPEQAEPHEQTELSEQAERHTQDESPEQAKPPEQTEQS